MTDFLDRCATSADELTVLRLENHRLTDIVKACDAVIAQLRDDLAKQMSAGDKMARNARVVALETALATLVKQLRRIGGFATYADQQELREAEAVLCR